MEDIHMGDTHLIAIDDCGVDDDDEQSCDQYVALIVALHRNKFDFPALDSGKFVFLGFNQSLKFLSVSSSKSG